MESLSDRLARNVAFIATMMAAGVDFVACDQPFASRLTLHILAAVAEDEARRISAQTKARWPPRRRGELGSAVPLRLRPSPRRAPSGPLMPPRRTTPRGPSSTTSAHQA